MARKKKKNIKKKIPEQRPSESSYWKITAVLASIFAIGLFVKVAFFQDGYPVTPATPVNSYQPPPLQSASLENQVRRVASNFKCACGGCGELPLVECSCDMPRGAVEEKNYIRNKLREGLTVDQVIQMVRDVYGHMII